MNDKKISARAVVTLTIEIQVGDRWGADCSTGQVFQQAEESALGMIRHWQEKDPVAMARVRVIGIPKVQNIIQSKES